KKLDRGLIASTAPPPAAGPALADLHHVVDGRGRRVRTGVIANGPRTTDGDALAHQAHCPPGLLRGQAVERAELILRPPAAPITESAKVLEDSFFGWYALLHNPSSTLVWIPAAIVSAA